MASEALKMPEVSAENGTSLTQSTPSFQHNKIWGMFGKLAGGGQLNGEEGDYHQSAAGHI